MARKRPPKSAPYEVGYRKPPTHSRFKPGHSGNPRGRPKRRLTLYDLIQEEGLKKVRIKEQGDEQTLTKIQVVAKAILANAMKGDAKAQKTLFEVAAKAIAATPANSPDLSAEDEEILRRYASRPTDEEANND